MEKKIRFGLIGIGAQGGAYAGFLTGKAGMPGMPVAPCPPHCELGALCDIRSSQTGKKWLHPVQ